MKYRYKEVETTFADGRVEIDYLMQENVWGPVWMNMKQTNGAAVWDYRVLSEERAKELCKDLESQRIVHKRIVWR